MMFERRKRGRPKGSTSNNVRKLSKMQRWTQAEWEEVKDASLLVQETPSYFIRKATLQRCKEIQ